MEFDRELRLVELYLEIEYNRLDGSLQYDCDIEYIDFTLPPLCLYTLVENAIDHGIRDTQHGGTLGIFTRKLDNCIEVTITDDGVGFDTNAAPRIGSVGLDNIRKRLAITNGGSLAIHSTVGVGTTAILTLPLLDEATPPRKNYVNPLLVYYKLLASKFFL